LDGLSLGHRGFFNVKNQSDYVNHIVKQTNLRRWGFVEDGFKLEEESVVAEFVSFLSSLRNLDTFLLRCHERLVYNHFSLIMETVCHLQKLHYLLVEFPTITPASSTTKKKSLRDTELEVNRDCMMISINNMRLMTNLQTLVMLINEMDSKYVIEQLGYILPDLKNLEVLCLPHMVTKISEEEVVAFIKICSKKLSLREFEFKIAIPLREKNYQQQLLKVVASGFLYIKEMRIGLPIESKDISLKIVKAMLYKPNMAYLQLINMKLGDHFKLQLMRNNYSNCILHFILNNLDID